MFQNNTFVFLDESGSMDFSAKSTEYVVLAGIVIRNDPEILLNDYWRLRHELYINPIDDSVIKGVYRNRRFHAASDPQEIRNRVFALICDHLDKISCYALVIKKEHILDFLRNREWLYRNGYYFMTRTILARSPEITQTAGIRFIIDQTEAKKLRRITRLGIRRAMNEYGHDAVFNIHHSTSYGHPFLQLADYFCWAIFREAESGDDRSYRQVNPAILNRWNLFA